MAVSRGVRFKDKLLGKTKKDYEQVEELRQRIHEYKEMVSSLDENVSYTSDLKNDIEIMEGDLLSDLLDLASGTEYPKELCEGDNRTVYSKSKALRKHYYIDVKYEEKLEESMFPATGEETTTLRASSYFNQIAHKIQRDLIEESEFLGFYSLNEKDNERHTSGKYKKALAIAAEEEIELNYYDARKAIDSENLDLENCKDENVSNLIKLMNKIGVQKRFITRKSLSSFNDCLRLYTVASDVFDAKTAAYQNLVHSYLAKEKEGLEHKVDIGYQEDKQNTIKGGDTVIILGKGEKDLLPTAGHIASGPVNTFMEKFKIKLPKYEQVPTKGTCNVPLELADMDNPRLSRVYREYLNDVELYNDSDSIPNICANRFDTIKTAIEKLVKLNMLNKGEENRGKTFY